MKKKSLLIGLLVVAMSSMAFAQYTPLPDLNSCTGLVLPFAPLPAFGLVPPATPTDAVDFTASDGNYAFCEYADTIFCSLAPLATALPEIADFAFLVQCLNMDINGPLDLEADIPVTSNGIPDASYELGILAAVLNDPSEPLHAAALAGFKQYYQNIKDLVVQALTSSGYIGLVSMFAPNLVGSLTGVLAADATMGDATTNEALNQLLLLLEDLGLTPPPGGIGSLGTAVPELGPEGDADGDGYTNRQEYNYFVGSLQYPAADYVAAALDPEQTLPAVLKITGPTGRVPLGSDVTISVEVLVGTAVNYQWYKDGTMLEGETGSAVELLNAQVADSGAYRVDVNVDDGAGKAVELYSASFTLNVSEFSVPVGGAFGLIMLAGACGMAGVAGLRRRK